MKKGITEASDTFLISEIQKGNSSAFNKLFNRYGNKLYFFGLSFFKLKEEAEEMVQDIFCIIWEKRAHLNPKDNFRSYLFTIAYNYIKRYFKHRHIVQKYLSQLTEQDSETTPNEYFFQSLEKRIDQLIDTLPGRRQEIFRKSRYEGKNTQEIAKELNISPKTVENQITTALSYLRNHLEKEHFILLLFFLIFY